MNKARAKLQSRRGASITFALLLFLVCAVVSSVVVVAGSAVGGRMSQLAESDRRYYAVTSAAELLRSTFEGQTVVVTTDKATGTQTVPADTDEILAHASKQLVQLQGLDADDPEQARMMTFRLSAGEDEDKKGLVCTIGETIRRNGQLEFEVVSGNVAFGNVSGTYMAENAAGAYTLRVVFSSEVRESAADALATTTTTAVTWKMTGARRGGQSTT